MRAFTCFAFSRPSWLVLMEYRAVQQPSCRVSVILEDPDAFRPTAKLREQTTSTCGTPLLPCVQAADAMLTELAAWAAAMPGVADHLTGEPCPGRNRH